ncbi:MAG: hypothetical protein ACRDCB_06780 [Clostridium sp.]
MNSRNIRKRTKKLLDNTQEYIGEGIAAVVNVALDDSSGVSGAISKTVFGKSVQALANKLDPCQLTEWEKKRIANCMVSAVDKIKENFKNGEKLRDDGFFEENSNGKINAEEVFESIVIASQREAEEMKQIFYGNMLANIGFIEYLDREDFLFLLKMFEKLTYRQCLILAAFYMNFAHQSQKLANIFKENNELKGNDIQTKEWIFYQEVLDLYQKSLLFSGKIIFNVTQIVPSELITFGAGQELVYLAGLDRIVQQKGMTDKHLEDLKVILDKVVDKGKVKIFIKDKQLFVEDKKY